MYYVVVRLIFFLSGARFDELHESSLAIASNSLILCGSGTTKSILSGYQYMPPTLE